MKVKSLSKTLFVSYLLILMWLVLFKFSYDIGSVLFDHQTRVLNLAPFLDSSRSEVISNFIVFIPLGLLLCINFKQLVFWQKLAIVFLASLAVEVLQYVLAIGVTDITDLMANTLGGFTGLVLYGALAKLINPKTLDLVVVILGWSIVIFFLFLRVFVFKVQY